MSVVWGSSLSGLPIFNSCPNMNPFLWFGLWMMLILFFLALNFTRQTVKDDNALIYEDWKECILPLVHSDEFGVDPNYFGVEDYFYAKSLVASRSFQIDDYHGFGMVPLADLFNHKTGAEDVHFTSATQSDSDTGSVTSVENDGTGGLNMQTSQIQENGSSAASIEKGSSSDHEFDHTQDTQDNPMVLEMILVKDVKAGTEVFNTYGTMGNAALLHRYGFTELDNPYDIVNIDLDLVLQWSSSLFSGRYTRSRLSSWRKLGYSGCVSQNSEYFEISFDGKPQLELLTLLYTIFLPEESYTELDLMLATDVSSAQYAITNVSRKCKVLQDEISETNYDMLLTKGVRKALLSLADMRDGLYGTTLLDHDLECLRKCDCIAERKLYHSLVLRVSERQIIRKLRSFAETGSKSVKRAHMRKKLKL